MLERVLGTRKGVADLGPFLFLKIGLINNLKFMKKILIILICSLFFVPFLAYAYTPVDGDLVKAPGFSAIYLVKNDGRYSFPFEKVYTLRYGSDFTNVKTIPLTDLSNLTLKGNVLLPNNTLVKITTDPKVYKVVNDNNLEWIQTEADAIAFAGKDWATLVVDLPDVFFADYKITSPMASAPVITPAPAPTPASNPANLSILNPNSGLTITGQYADGSWKDNKGVTHPACDPEPMLKFLPANNCHDQFVWDSSEAGILCKAHPEWLPVDCDRIANGGIWIGMTYDMLVASLGRRPDSANLSNYGSRNQWQWCWHNHTPSCFYGGDDEIITSYN